MWTTGRLRSVAGVVILLGLTACESTISLPPLTTMQDRPKNIIERALSACFEKVGDARSDCVKARLVDDGLAPAGLITLIPGCRAGRTCAYDYETAARIGYVSAYATHVVHPLHVTFDLGRQPKTLSDVPVTVEPR